MKLIKFIMVFLLLIAVAIAGGYLFRNNIITYLGERYLSTANGALVEIEGLDNEIFTLNMHIDKLKVTNKENLMENLVEVEGAYFSFELEPLLAGKYIVDKMSIDKVEMDTKRSVEGKMPEKWVKKENEEKEDKEPKEENEFIKDIKGYVGDKVEDEKQKIAIINLQGDNTQEKLDEILEMLDLNLKKEYEKSRKHLEGRVAFWEGKIDNNTYKEDVDSIKQKIEGLDYDFDRIKDIKTIDQLKEEGEIAKKKADEVKALIEEAKEVAAKVEADKKLLEKEIKDLDRLKSDFMKAANSDYEKVKLLVTLDKNSLIELSTTLFGDRITNYITLGLEKYSRFRALQKEKKKDGEKAPKEEKMPELPRLWIKEARIKYVEKGKEYIGSITDISTNQDRTKKPIILALKDHKENKIDVVYDSRGEKNQTKLDFVYKDVELKDKYIRESNGLLTGTFLLEGLSIDGRVDLLFDKFLLNHDEVFRKQKYADILEKITKGMNETKVALKVKYTNEDKEIKIKSNLDEELYKGIGGLLEKEVEDLKKEVEKRAKAKIEGYRAKLIKELEKESKKLGLAFGEDEAEALKNVENLEDLKKAGEDYYSKVEKEYKRRILEKFMKGKKEYIAKLKKETEKLGINLRKEHYEALERATAMDELEKTGNQIIEDIKEEKRAEVEAKLKAEQDKLEDKAKDELKDLGDKLKGKFKF